MRTHYIKRSATTGRDSFLAGAELGYAQANALGAPVVAVIAGVYGEWLVAALFTMGALGGWLLWWRTFRFALRIRVRPEPVKPTLRIIADTTHFEAAMRNIGEEIKRAMKDIGPGGAA